jgi:hypothetical protein
VEKYCRARGHRRLCGARALHAGYLRLQTYSLLKCNTYCFSTATMGKIVARKRLNITLYLHYNFFLFSLLRQINLLLMIATEHNTLKSGTFLSHSRHVLSKWTKFSSTTITSLCFSWEVNCYFYPKYNFPERVVFFSYLHALRSSKFRARFVISSSNVFYRLQIRLTSPNKNRSFAISNSKFDVSSLRSLQTLKFVIPEFLNWVPFCGKKLIFYTVIQCNRNSKNNN